MFNSLTGRITGRGPNTLYLSTGGVEWELEVSGYSLRHLAAHTADDEIRVFTFLYHREDQMRLYGFSSQEERRVFLELTSVSGIGPRAAVKLLSGTSPAELIRMLEAEDVDGLVRLPGLGRKTAQKVILALRGRLVAGESADGAGGHAELVEGLVEMGFDRSRATKVVNEIAAELATAGAATAGGAELEKELFRLAIVRLAGE